MATIAITAYHAQAGHEEQVATLLAAHWDLLHDEGFTTDQPAFLMRASQDSGIFVEVFAWRDAEGPDRAWENPKISELWNEIQAHCERDIVPEYYEQVVALAPGGG